jgi:hypothetical protein
MTTRSTSKTLEGFNTRSIGVRVFILKSLLEHLSSICDDTGASISTVTNAALKVALCHPNLILEDIKGMSLNASRKHN